MAILSARRAALAAAFAASAGCDPEILSGSYFCGPELACPEGQVCSAADGTCVRPGAARPFECPPGETGEPNEDAATARVMTIGQCPAAGVDLIGCLPDPRDIDWVEVVVPLACIGGDQAIDVRYPAAFAPAVVERMAADGRVAEVAPSCDITGGIGANDAVCLRTQVPADGRTMLRLTFDDELVCGGACDFAHYSIRVEVTQ